MLKKAIIFFVISIALQSCLAKSHYSADEDDDSNYQINGKPPYKTDQYGSKSYGKSHSYEDSDDSYSSNAYAKLYNQAYASKKYLDDLYATKKHHKSYDDDGSYNSKSSRKSYDNDAEDSYRSTRRKSYSVDDEDSYSNSYSNRKYYDKDSDDSGYKSRNNDDLYASKIHRKSHSSYSDDDDDLYASKSSRRSHNHKKSKAHDSYPESTSEDSFKEIKAIAVLKGFFEGSPITGTVKFSQTSPHSLQVTVDISGLRVGKGSFEHALHVHTNGIMDSSNNLTAICLSSGPHFNPKNVTHGDIKAAIRHVGDYGNVISDNKGVISVTFVDKVSKLSGPFSILGRTLVLHEKSDDMGKGGSPLSTTTGNAGGRIACGVIGVSS